MGLEFETAARDAATDELDEGTFVHDGYTVTYYRPSQGQIALVMAYTDEKQNDQRKVMGLVDFFYSILDEQSQKHFQARLWDRTDPFDVSGPGGINAIVAALLKEWSGRPTQRSSDSTQSPATTGPESKPDIPALSS